VLSAEFSVCSGEKFRRVLASGHFFNDFGWLCRMPLVHFPGFILVVSSVSRPSNVVEFHTVAQLQKSEPASVVVIFLAVL